MSKCLTFVLAGLLLLASGGVLADAKTEREVRDQVLASNAYVKKMLKGDPGDYSKEGAVEFWSSGGLMQEIDPDGRDAGFEMYNIDVKHIKVLTLVPGKAAVAHFYSEGAMKPKGFPASTNYRTRATQVFVKEGGSWKVRSSHWSAISGGAGTTQTAIVEE